MAMHSNRYYCGKCHLTYLIKKEQAKRQPPPPPWGVCGLVEGKTRNQPPSP